MMMETTEALQYEVKRLREIIERQYLELAWQQSELATRGGKATVVRFGAGDLARGDLAGNAGLLRDTREPPPAEHWPLGAAPAMPLTPNCGFASYSSGRELLNAVGIAVCGLDVAQVEHIVAMVETRLRKARNFRPVFLMDITRTEIFRRRGFAYEYLAPCSDKEQRLAPRLAAFNASRVALLTRKWGLAGIINFGPRNATGDQRMANSGRRTQIAVNSAVDADGLARKALARA
jgi:hypothetical protein